MSLFDSDLCRLCLHVDKNSKDLESDDFQFNQNNIKAALKDVFNIRINSNQNLPTHVCTVCSKKLTDFYTFYLDVMSNQAKLLLGIDKFSLPKGKFKGITNKECIENKNNDHEIVLDLDCDSESEIEFLPENHRRKNSCSSDSTINIPCEIEGADDISDDRPPSNLLLRRTFKEEPDSYLQDIEIDFLLKSNSNEHENEEKSDESPTQDEIRSEMSTPDMTLPDLAHNPDFTPTDHRPEIQLQNSDDPHSMSQTTEISDKMSQETILSDDIAHDSTYTPPASIGNNESDVSTSSDDDENDVKINSRPKRIKCQKRMMRNSFSKYESDDSDVQIIGVKYPKRKLAQPEITNFFYIKKEKLEPK
uniref:CSON010368 protein n=1 Tax=Culicoides sonorensis TaxID=179676 RepID=A0A336LL36_CULSO